MPVKKYTRDDALSDFWDQGIVDHYSEKKLGQKRYYWIKWRDETDRVDAAVGATLYIQHGFVPFGIQKALLSSETVSEVVLICREWEHFFRIPASQFRNYSLTEKAGRLYFNVGSDDRIRSRKTVLPIPICSFRIERVSHQRRQ